MVVCGGGMMEERDCGCRVLCVLVLSSGDGRNSKFLSSGGVTSGYWEWDDAGVDAGDVERNCVVFVWTILEFEIGEEMGVVSGVVFGFWGMAGNFSGELVGIFSPLLVKSMIV